MDSRQLAIRNLILASLISGTLHFNITFPLIADEDMLNTPEN